MSQSAPAPQSRTSAQYDRSTFQAIEKKWQTIWKERRLFAAPKDDFSRPKYYILDMFPYPSGAGLHVGHPLGYIATDIIARYKRLQGYNVLHPMGFDAFGLPAENYAVQTGIHPAVSTEQNIKRYLEQIEVIGLGHDPDTLTRTSDPDFYRWTQWIFLQLFDSWYDQSADKARPIADLVAILDQNGNAAIRAASDDDTPTLSAAEWKALTGKAREDFLQHYRLAYLSYDFVNWCAALGTVLANEEVKDGLSERGGHPVERVRMRQWSLRMTAYADRLLRGLNTLDWPESIKDQQRNWIGKSEGASIQFVVGALLAAPVTGLGESASSAPTSSQTIVVFTTRPDTIFGVSFLVLAPEHELVDTLTTSEQRAAVEAYVAKAKNKSERERQSEVKTVTGVFTGSYATHPFTRQPIPVWIGEYVLAGYGTGAIMAVPGHDERDHAFARTFDLRILKVVDGPDVAEAANPAKEGTIVNSEFLDGLAVKAAIARAIQEVEAKGIGKGRTTYRLRDAIFSRQRYWGEPIPIVYDAEGTPNPLPESALPLELPAVESYKPTGTGDSPLAAVTDWVNVTIDGKPYRRETNTMPGWAGSSWYFFRYLNVKDGQWFADPARMQHWAPVDLYLGGSEHAVGHLLYSRFWTQFLFDRGWSPVQEYAQKLVNQGMIQGMTPFAHRRSKGTHYENNNTRNFTTGNGQMSYYSKKNYLILKDDSLVNIHNNNPSFFFSKDVIDKYKFLHTVSEGNGGWEVTIKYEGNDFRLPTEAIANGEIINFDSIFNVISDYRHWNFVVENGYWFDGQFYHFKNDDNSPPAPFLVVREEVEKMSKSKYNVVNPEDLCRDFGADTFRMYEMFLGPLEQSKPWNTNGITGVHNFLKKFWRMYVADTGELQLTDDAPTPEELKILHQTIKKIAEDVERLSFNTSVPQFMIATNELTRLGCRKRAILEPLLVVLSPYAPHLCEELWERLGHADSILNASYPQLEERYLVESEFEYPVSINGKTRGKLRMAADITPADAEPLVRAYLDTTPDVAKYLTGPIKKLIIVPGRIVNVVV